MFIHTYLLDQSNLDHTECSLFVSSGDDEINLAGGPSKFVTDISVNDKGKCVWSGPATFKVNCRMKIESWPFDEQKCALAFGSFSYGKNLLILKLFKDKSNFASKELASKSINC